MYEETKSVGAYLFIGVAASAMLVQIASDSEISTMTVVVALLWGLAALGFGRLIWEFLGDMIMPYIHSESTIEETAITDQGRQHNVPRGPINTPFQIDSRDFERHVNKYVNEGKLWARGMTILEGDDERELRAFFRKRWTDEQDNIEVPSNISDSLLIKLQTRKLVGTESLTSYGERIIPWGQSYNTLVQMNGN